MTPRPWFRCPFIGFDLETNGVDVESARIVTASAVRWGGGLDTITYCNWISDLGGAEIPADAQAIHKISTEQARAEGLPAAEVVAGIVSALRHLTASGWPVVAMNAPFDLTILDRECERYGVPSLGASAMFVLDPRVLDKQLDRFRKGRRRLVDLCQHYGAPMVGAAHTSEADARAACAVTWKIIQRNRTLQHVGLGELHRAQIGWAREHQESFLGFQRRTQGFADEAPFDWPLIPRPVRQAARD